MISRHFDLLQEDELVTGDEVGPGDQIRRTDGPGAKAQVGDGTCSGFLGVVHKISLSEEIRVFADDLDAVLIGSDRTIRAEAEEQALPPFGFVEREGRVVVQTGKGYVVVDPHGEVVPGFGFFQFIKDSLGHGRSEFFGGETVASAHEAWKPLQSAILETLYQGCEYVLVEGLTYRTRLFGAVEHGDGCHVRG